MPISTQCTHCQAKYMVPDTLAGKKVKCRKCGGVFQAAALPAPPNLAGQRSPFRDPEQEALDAMAQLAGGGLSDTDVDAAAPDLAPVGAGAHRKPGRYGANPPPAEMDVSAPVIGRPKFRAPRRKIELDIPFADYIDGLLPWLLVAAWLGLTVWDIVRRVRRDENPVADWGEWVFGAITVATIVLILTPLMSLGAAIASRVRNFFLPDAAPLRILAAVAACFLMVKLLADEGGVVGNAQERQVAFFVSVAVGIGVLALLFRLGFLDSLITIALIVAFAVPGFVLANLIRTKSAKPLAEASRVYVVRDPGSGEVKRFSREDYAKYQKDEERRRLAALEQQKTDPFEAAPVQQTPDRSWETVPTVKVDPNAARDPYNPGPRLLPDGKPVPPPPVDPALTLVDLPAGGGQQSAGLPVVTTTLDQPQIGEFDAILAPERPSPWVFVKRRETGGQPNAHTIERISVANWQVAGALRFGDEAEEMAFSPDGEYVVRKVRFPQAQIEISAFATGQTLPPMKLNSPTAELVGFVGPDKFAVYGGVRDNRGRPSGALGIVDAKTGKPEREIKLAGFDKGAVGISPDGKTIAVVTKDDATTKGDGPPQVALYASGTGGGGAPRRIPLKELAADASFFDPKAVAFDDTGSRLAVEIGVSGTSKLYCWADSGRTLVASHSIPNLDQIAGGGGALNAQRGRRLEWLGDTNCLLVNGRLVLDVESGRFVGRVGEGDVLWHRSVGDNRLLLRERLGPQEQFTAAQVDLSKLKELAAAARKAGRVIFDPPALDPKQAQWAIGNVLPKADIPSGKLGAPPDPAPSPGAAVGVKPIPLTDVPAEHLRDVTFPAPNMAVVYANAAAGAGQWDPLAGAGAALVRYDLAAGKATGRVSIPMWGREPNVSPDGEFAVTISRHAGAAAAPAPNARGSGARGVTVNARGMQPPPPAGAGRPVDRVDVWSVANNRHVAGFAPYAAATNPAGRAVLWADLADKDGLLTLSTGNVLIRWAISGRRAVWMRAGVVEAPVLSPGGKYMILRQGNSVLVVDPATGNATSTLANPPLNYTTISAHFSPDGRTLLASTTAGLLRWDVTKGSVQTLRPEPQDAPAEMLGVGSAADRFALVGDRLFDADAGQFVFTYRTAGGQHLYGGPAGRHWYVARTPDDPTPHLCSAAIPTPDQLKVAEQITQNPPMIRPGVRIDLRVDAGSASPKVSEVLTQKVKDRGLLPSGTGEVVATLRFSAQLVDTGETVPYRNLGPNRSGTEEVKVQNYHCYYELVDAKGTVLYGSPYHVIPGKRALVSPDPNQSIAARIQAEMDNAVAAWAQTVYVPTYLTSDGQVPVKPEALLGVQ